jgi:hypothetical protein
MLNPSPQILNCLVNIFIGTQAQDVEGALQGSYPASPTMGNVPCSVQYQDAVVVAENDRITTINTYWILFGIPVIQSPRMMIVWVDKTTGMSHTLFADGLPPSEAGRGGAYTIRAIEKI